MPSSRESDAGAPGVAWGGVLAWLVVWLGALLFATAAWIRRVFGPVTVDQLLMHLPVGDAETTGAETGYIADFVLWAFILPSVLVLAAHLVVRRLSRSRTPRMAIGRAVLPRRGVVDTRRLSIRRYMAAMLAACVGLAGAGHLAQTIGLADYLRSTLTNVSMRQYYVVPTDDDLAYAVAQREDGGFLNLVTVYLESGEQALGDDDLFEVDMIRPLEDATADWARFEHLSSYEGGGRTMAGLVGMECGVPLRGGGRGVDDINSNNIGAASDNYMSSAVCLGDVLSDAGYHGIFMGGADAWFASKGDFLRDHGYDEVLDLNWWRELGETEVSDWGLSDARLFEHAKEQISRLHEAGELFHLSLLTLDLHEPAHLFEGCPLVTEVEMASVALCSFGYVAEFVDYLREMGYLDDTVVIIVADHPKMLGEGAAFHAELSELSERPLFNRIWSPEGVRLGRMHADQLSLYATTLDLLGLGRPDGRAGVGVSALAGRGVEGTALDLTDAQYETLITSRSTDLYRQLWGLDEPEDHPR